MGPPPRRVVRLCEQPFVVIGWFPQPQHMPCETCGAAVERAARDEHVCDPERLVDYLLFQLRDEVAALEAELAAYLDSPSGRFEAWYAERQRGRRPRGG